MRAAASMSSRSRFPLGKTAAMIVYARPVWALAWRPYRANHSSAVEAGVSPAAAVT